MLNLIFLVIMFGVKVESCANLCECNKFSVNPCDRFLFSNNTTSQCLFSATMLPENSVNNTDFSTVIIKSGEKSSARNSSNITTVILTKNHLEEIPNLILDYNEMVALDLSQNNLKTIDTDIFKTLNLRKLNLSLNAITKISNSSYLNLQNLTNLDLSSNRLTSIQNLIKLSCLQYLNLSNNNLKVLNGAGFNNLQLLQHLDVSRNQLIRNALNVLQLPNLASLLIAENRQIGKSRNIFVFVGTSHKLKTLDASGTGLKQVPATLTHSIQFLSLRENSIQRINCGDLDSYSLLQSLDLTSNKIQLIEDDSLGRLEFLSVLLLTDNQLVEIPDRLPEKLKYLHLEINKITEIRKKDLQGLTILEVLLLNDNNITVINNGAFSELTSLIKLDLSRNPLINLEPGTFIGPLSLQTLRLSTISTIEKNPFPLSMSEQLVTLDLSYSPKLAQQFLSDTATLMAAKRLEKLDLSGGNLEYLRQDLQFYLPQLKLMRIKDNKFKFNQINLLKSWFCVNLKEETKSSTETDMVEVKSSTTEVNKYSNNEVYYEGKVSELAPNLLVSYKKDQVRSIDTPAVDKRENSIKWNVSAGELSMYKSSQINYLYRNLFLVVSTAFVVCAVGVFLILRFIRMRRMHVDDIEATALPTISDIW